MANTSDQQADRTILPPADPSFHGEIHEATRSLLLSRCPRGVHDPL
jgi:hypothetical protein